MIDSKEADAGAKRTLVEEGTEVKGSIRSTCPLLVRGRIEGDIDAPSMTISPSGAVHGKVKVGELKSDGEIAGEFNAETVQLSGTVKDKTVLRARTLEVKLESKESRHQVLFGECELEVGEPPTREKRKKGGDQDPKPEGSPEPTG
ncbi:MAG: polymer-forming cytoskeletal protein [Deltaproteobacteria bacterium]|nr:polymer-forming cytoskeletal protein [Deltaproteobacteria bacterium]